MNNAIVSAPDRFPSVSEVVDSIVDAESAKECVNNVEKLRKMLDVADEWGRYASQYCIMEAEMYARISEIPDATKNLPQGKKDLIEWFASKTKAEKSAILKECEAGTRLHLIRNRELRANKDEIEEQKQLAEYSRIQESIIDDLKYSGTTKCSTSEFFDRWTLRSSRPNAQAVKAYVERTRDKLLKINGRGIGDGNGTYLLPSKCERDEIAEIVSTRLRSIVADINQLSAICKEASFVVPKRGIEIMVSAINELEQEHD